VAARRAVPLAAALALVLAACGGSDGGGAADDVATVDGSTSATGAGTTPTTDGGEADPQEAMLAFTECMRAEGIDMPDPQPGGGGVTMIQPGEMEGDFEAANEVCQPLLEDAIGSIELDPEQVAEQREQMLAYAECMREQGIDMPDPQFGDDGSVQIEIGGRAEPGVEVAGPGDPMSEEWQAAAEACDDVLGGGPMVVGAAPVGG